MPKQSEYSSHPIHWKLFSFNELSNTLLYDIIKLRQEVFIVEQDCPYLDTDGYDQGSLHLIGISNKSLVAYARILPPSLYYKEAAIGRIVCAPAFRGKGLGKRTVSKALEIMKSRYGDEPIRIMAQSHLAKFYEEFEFEKTGEEFLEDGIPHIEMVKK